MKTCLSRPRSLPRGPLREELEQKTAAHCVALLTVANHHSVTIIMPNHHTIVYLLLVRAQCACRRELQASALLGALFSKF